jgi:putative N-acetyltransferase (TIGR04045 family)
MAGRAFRSSAMASPPRAGPAGPVLQALPGPAPTASGPPLASRPLLACRAVRTAAERAAHFRIRRLVFVLEQGLFCDPGAATGGDDTDAHDDDPATIHVIGLADTAICGTVRLYPLSGEPGRWKGDRLAVLPGHRHLGLGAPLVRFAVAAAGQLGGQQMEAYIQPANVTFFEHLGWQRTGGLVSYAGIPHQRMLIGLSS